MERNHAVDSLKGICIILIIITHCGWGGAEQKLVLFPYIVEMAVPTFMFLSGYIGSMTSFNSYKRTVIIKKYLRFTIPFLVMWILELIILCYSGRRTLSEVLMTILTGGIGPGSYYYPLMIQFILIFPLIYRVVKKNKAFGLAIMGGLNVLYELLVKAYAMGGGCYRLLIFRYLLIITIGAYFNMYGCDIKRSICILMFALSAAYIYLVALMDIDPVLVNNDWAGTSYFVVSYLSPIISLYVIKCKDVKINILEIIGKASYNIYLVQMVYFATAMSLINQTFSNLYIKNAFNIVMCIALGLLFYIFDSKCTNEIIKNLVPQIDKTIDKARSRFNNIVTSNSILKEENETKQSIG